MAQALATAGGTGMRALLDDDADAGGRRDLVQRGGQAAARGVAQHVQVRGDGEHRLDQTAQRRAVALDLHTELQALADAHDRDAVEADRAADDHDVTRDDALRTQVDAVGMRPMPGGVDVDAVAVAGLDHLGVAGRHLDPGGARGGAHRLGHARDAPRPRRPPPG